MDVTPIESAKSYNGNGRTVSGPDPSVLTTRLASPVDASIIVRLHFAEAMMVLLFNASDEMQQNAVKRGFGKLLAKMDNLEMLGTPTGTLQAYREGGACGKFRGIAARRCSERQVKMSKRLPP